MKSQVFKWHSQTPSQCINIQSLTLSTKWYYNPIYEFLVFESLVCSLSFISLVVISDNYLTWCVWSFELHSPCEHWQLLGIIECSRRGESLLIIRKHFYSSISGKLPKKILKDRDLKLQAQEYVIIFLILYKYSLLYLILY